MHKGGSIHSAFGEYRANVRQTPIVWTGRRRWAHSSAGIIDIGYTRRWAGRLVYDCPNQSNFISYLR